jgi:hypothetical protein
MAPQRSPPLAVHDRSVFSNRLHWITMPEIAPWEGAMSDVTKPAARKSASFAEFYPFYLSEHSDRTCRRLHFAGSTLALLCLVTLIVTRNPWWLLAGLVCGYGFAWIGHFVFEKNQPASFKQPLYSLMGDWKMYWQILTGKIAF